MYLFPKGEFLRTHRVGPLGLNGFLHLGLLFGFFHPYESWPLFSGWWVGGGGGGRITSKKFYVSKIGFFLLICF